MTIHTPLLLSSVLPRISACSAGTLLFVLLWAMTTFADDVGISEARLIEEAGHVYALEADVSPMLAGAIQEPILPERCVLLGKVERVQVGPILVVRYRFSSGDDPLNKDDELLLPWGRLGLFVTAHWQDETSHRTFFAREPAGIFVEMARLRETTRSRAQILKQGVRDAWTHAGSAWWVHLLLVMGCALAGPTRRMAGLLMAFAAGHGLALVATDLGAAAFPGFMAEVMMGVAAVLLFRSAANESSNQVRFWPVLTVLGLLHGLGYVGGSGEGLSSAQLLDARFAFNTSMDMLHATLGVGAWVLFGVVLRSPGFRRVTMYAGGSLAVAATLVAGTHGFKARNLDGQPGVKSTFELPSTGSPSGAVPPPSRVTEPIIGFVTISPFEVRCEWLLRARDLEPPTGEATQGQAFIPIDAQSAFKDRVLARFSTETTVTIDGRPRKSASRRADFVTVSAYGVGTRSVPEPEPLDTAVLGITLAYLVDDAPETVSLQFQPHPVDAGAIPIAISDPWGSTLRLLTEEDPQAEWKRRLAGFRRPPLRAVALRKPTWPVASMVLLAVAVTLVVLIRRGRVPRRVGVATMVCLVVAIAAYPFVRTTVPAALSRHVPAPKRTQQALRQLLMNVYRAFDYRTEEAIYDQLAVSISGEQLTQIYLEQRRALELENRGGARAQVDEVEVTSIDSVKAGDEGGLHITATWTVSGSVSHFGHTHYRRNRYRAVVHMVPINDTWKIAAIEILDEQRAL